MSCLLTSILHSYWLLLWLSLLLIIVIIIIVLNSRELNNNQIKDVTNLGKAGNLSFWTL